jgi:hypothetical protein
MKVFASGSCRLVTTINSGYGLITPIHSMFYNFTGINFLGKLHNSKQHIQFIKFLKGELFIPADILPSFLTSFNVKPRGFVCDKMDILPLKIENIRKQFDECDWYIFEISSLKLFKRNGFEVMIELINNYDYSLQTENELMNDLIEIRKMIPLHKKILFQTHIRPNIIYNDKSKIINNREQIYNIVNEFCNNNHNCYLYDPSILLNKNHSLFDGDTHFTQEGHRAIFHNMYQNYLSIL